jgi:hypothetical protein
MAQLTLRANLSAANFPLCSDFSGRSVVIPNQDQAYVTPSQFSGADTDKDRGIPQIYYCHNVMPVGQGFKSIAYRKVITGIPTTTTKFNKVIAVRDNTENRGYVGFTSDGLTFLYQLSTNTWKNVSIPGTWVGGNVTTATASGVTYICYEKWGIYTVDLVAGVLTSASLSGITNANVVGMCAAANYLILHDGYTVYWSSATNPTDFVPSLATGASSGVPTGIGGIITAITSLGTGFAVYTTVNIVLSSYSGNTRYPWIFREAPGGAGSKDIEGITNTGDDGTNYAWTSSGLLKITAQGCNPVFPEVTDFLSGRIFEDFVDATLSIESEYLLYDLKVKLSYASSRYLVISYGKQSLTHALVYDIALKRWGKLRVAHVDAFELTISSDGAGLTYANLAPKTYAQLAPTPYNELTKLVNTAASPKRTLAFLQADGSVQIALWDYGNYKAQAVIMLGKFQLTRSQVVTLEEFVVENVDLANSSNFTASVITSLDGKDQGLPLTIPPVSVIGSQTRTYRCRVTGVNHSLLFTGAFNLVSLVLAFSKHGRR